MGKKNKKHFKKDNDNSVMTVIGLIASAIMIFLVAIYPKYCLALAIFWLCGADSERWARMATQAKIAREWSDPARS